MFLRVYAMEQWFVIPPLVHNVSALHGETWTPEIVFSVTVTNWVFAEITHMIGSKWNFARWVFLEDIVLIFEFQQNRSSAFGAVGCRIWRLAYTQELIRRWDSEREPLCSAPGIIKLPEFAEITHNNGHYAFQGHSRSLILVPIESSYMISY